MPKISKTAGLMKQIRRYKDFNSRNAEFFLRGTFCPLPLKMVQRSPFLPNPLSKKQVGSKAIKPNQRVALGWVVERQQCSDAGSQCPHGCTLSVWQEFSHLIPLSKQTVLADPVLWSSRGWQGELASIILQMSGLRQCRPGALPKL